MPNCTPSGSSQAHSHYLAEALASSKSGPEPSFHLVPLALSPPPDLVGRIIQPFWQRAETDTKLEEEGSSWVPRPATSLAVQSSTLTPKAAGTLLKAPISLWPSSTLSHLLEGSGPDMGQNQRAPGLSIPSESIHWAPSVCRHTQRAIIRHRPCPHEAYRLPVFKSTFRSNNQS